MLTPATRRPTTLIVDDDIHIRTGLRELLEHEGHVIMEAGDGKSALEAIARGEIDLVLLDLILPRVTGDDVLRQMAADGRNIPVVIISGSDSIRRAVATARLGACDYLEKPVESELALRVIREALARSGTMNRSDTSGLRDQLGLVGTSAPMRQLYAQLARAARTNATVLLIGESGTGKELGARAIHANSVRRDGPFVPVNCAAIPENLIESELFGYERGAFTGATARRAGVLEGANGGTLFLDEVADMSLMTQAKLLRVLEERRFKRLGGQQELPFDGRLVSATNRDLTKAVELGDVRADLYYRLNVVRIDLVPLRSRPEDLPSLLDHFIRQFCVTQGRRPRPVTASALAVLLAYTWPGNVRELRNVAERIVALGDDGPIESDEARRGLQAAAVAVPVPAQDGLREARAEFERAFIRRALEAHDE
jgi:two-component system, NtrC family, nitrogen regulation response regulator NtrX